MKRYKNIIGKILVMSGTLISSICILYVAFSHNLILGIIVSSIMMMLFGLLLCTNENK